MPDVDPSMFPVHVTAVGSKRSDRDALLAALLDTLSVDDLRDAAFVTHTQGHRSLMRDNRGIAERLDRAADALAALKEATDG